MLNAMTMAGSWSELGLTPQSLSFLQEGLQFETMAPVQAATIPQMLRGMDVIVEAMTGSGKTLAYAVPMFEFMLTKHREQIEASIHAVHTVVVLPTRELGLQVCEVLASYAQHVKTHNGLDIRIMRAVGGYDTARDTQHYRDHGCHVLVATPGRLYELLSLTRGDIMFRVAGVELCILDEADRLLAMGFMTQLDDILKRLPRQRHTALFSATQTREVRELARCGLRRPVVINVRQTETGKCNAEAPQVPQQLRNYYCVLRYSRRLEALVKLISQQSEATQTKTLVYVLTCASVDWLCSALKVLLPDRHIAALHGQLAMSKRVNTHIDFVARESGVLVCTDVAARGLDIPDIDVVVQYDAPTDPKCFIHRIGRTARMGREGMSVLLLAPHEEDAVAYMKLQNIILMPMVILKGADKDQHADKERRLGSAVMKKGEIARAKKAKVVRKEVQGDLADSDVVTHLRQAYVADRTLMENATRAFASFIRGYKEHHCRYIYKFGDMDIVDLCNSFALFHVPNCSETRQMSFLHIPLPDEFSELDVRAIVHADPDREKKRQDKLVRRNEQKEVQRSARNERRSDIRDSTDMSKNAKRLAWKQLEVSEIMREGAWLQKVKQGKMTEEEYRRRTGEDVALDVDSRRERKKVVQSRFVTPGAEAPKVEMLPEPDLDPAELGSDAGSIDTTPMVASKFGRRKRQKKK